MKNSLFTLALFLISFFAGAQTYTVVHVKGAIMNNSTSKSLKPGDKIDASNEIKFGAKDAMALVISSEKGRMILKPNTGSSNTDSELLAVVKNTLLPTTGRLSTRAGGIVNLMDLQKQLGEGGFVCLEERAVKFDCEKVTGTCNGIFFVTFKYNGEAVNKKLEYANGSLILNRDEFLKVDDKIINSADCSDFKLMFLNKDDKTKVEITMFSPVFPDMAALEDELSIMSEAYSDYSPEQKKEEYIQFMRSIYGDVDSKEFNEWLEKSEKL